MGPSGYHWVSETSGAAQGSFGVYEHASRAAVSDQGWALPNTNVRIFPNRDVPNTQVSSRGIGWPSGTSDAWCVEYQVYLSAGKDLYSRVTNDADSGPWPVPEKLFDFALKASSGDLYTYYTDMTQGGGQTASGVVSSGVWHHIAVQKAAGYDQVRFFLDGVSRAVLTPLAQIPISNIDMFRLGSGTGAIVREVCVRSSAPYSSSGFASALGDTRLRWNSMML